MVRLLAAGTGAGYDGELIAGADEERPVPEREPGVCRVCKGVHGRFEGLSGFAMGPDVEKWNLIIIGIHVIITLAARTARSCAQYMKSLAGGAQCPSISFFDR